MERNEIEVRQIRYGCPEFKQAVELRLRVLRGPLGLSFSDEELAAEHDHIHLGAYRKGRLVGCLVLTPQSGEAVKMRQVAVEPSFQGNGIGSLLVRASEREASARGFKTMVLHARQTAVPFYLRLEYEVVGEPFDEVTIPHLAMRKTL